MSHVNQSAIHCINPSCQRPYPQPWGNKFCNSCGAPLLLLDRYVPVQRLGSGGFAQIYTVWDQKTQSEKVLKVLVENSPKAQELFAQEAAILISLNNPGVPKVEADGYFERRWRTVDGEKVLACLVMEKINGQTLEDVEEKYPQGCPQDLVLNWLTQAVEILHHLHQRKIIHRDIKPSNLMLRNSSGSASGNYQLVLIDFGGVKQFSGTVAFRQSNSTRLFSSGYSPPEQMIGGNVGPAADFYALGRTMIELLTHKYPADLEDPITGKLRWRQQINVNPQLADLLDEMVQEDVRSRPANAAAIQKRLANIHLPSTPVAPVPDFLSVVEEYLSRALKDVTNVVGNTTKFTIKAIANILLACVHTVWGIFLTTCGAFVGTVTGFLLAYRTIWGQRVAEIVYNQIPDATVNTPIITGAEIVVFAAAGLGTGWGLVAAGGFGQRRRYLVVSIISIIGYSLGWFFLELIAPKNSAEGLIGLILVAVPLLTLSLGLRSHHIVYAVVATLGTAMCFAFFIQLNLFPTNIFQFYNYPSWLQLWRPLIFFDLVAVFVSFFLAVSYYLIVPGLRFLGWR